MQDTRVTATAVNPSEQHHHKPLWPQSDDYDASSQSPPSKLATTTSPVVATRKSGGTNNGGSSPYQPSTPTSSTPVASDSRRTYIASKPTTAQGVHIRQYETEHQRSAAAHVEVEPLSATPTGSTTSVLKPHQTTPQQQQRQVLVEKIQEAVTAAGSTSQSTTAAAASHRQKAQGRHHRQARRGATPQEESVDHDGASTAEDWISELVENIWDPYIVSTLSDMSWEMLPDILNSSKSSWMHSIELTKLEFGRKEPDILDVRCYRDDSDVVDDVFLEMDVVWKSQQDIEFVLKVIGKNIVTYVPDILEAQLAKLLTMTVGIEDATLKGTIRMALRPLLTRVPIIGALQISFIELPEFDFKPDIVGGPLGAALNAILPAFKGWLLNTVRESILMPYVLPDHYFYQIDPSAHDIQTPVGMLHLRVIEAKQVPKMDIIGATDGFVELYMRNSERHKTAVKQGKNPKWDEKFVLPVHAPDHQKLQFILYDEDVIMPNDTIGRSQIDLSSLEQGKVHDLWLDVVNQDEEEREKAKQGDENALSAVGKRATALMKIAAPVVGHSTKDCKLHVRLAWRTWSKAEEQFIKDVSRKGVERALQTRQRPSYGSGGGSDSAAGGEIDSELETMVWSGLFTVTVKRCRGLKVSGGWFGRPSVIAEVRVGHGKPKKTSAAKVTKRGGLDLSGAPMVFDVDGETAKNRNTKAVVRLVESGWFSGGDEVGRVELSLYQLMQHSCTHKEFHLEEGGVMEVELRWQSIFA